MCKIESYTYFNIGVYVYLFLLIGRLFANAIVHNIHKV